MSRQSTIRLISFDGPITLISSYRPAGTQDDGHRKNGIITVSVNGGREKKVALAQRNMTTIFRFPSTGINGSSSNFSSLLHFG